MCVYHCVVHNTAAQNSSHDCPSYPPENQDLSDVLRDGRHLFFSKYFSKSYYVNMTSCHLKSLHNCIFKQVYHS